MATQAHITAADFAALLPDIAAGDLSRSSIAEVIAAGWRAHGTGTVAVEQGKGECRLFLRYGNPCGALLYTGFRSFGYFLLERGLIDPETLDRTLAQAAKESRRHGEVLVGEGLVSAAQLEELLHEQHQANLDQLSLLREGRYELRGWERPPPWTETLTLDPFRSLCAALRSEELFDRRRFVLDALGSTPLKRADDFEDQAARLFLQSHERAALERLRQPRPADELAENLVLREESEALVAALALLGLLEPAPAAARTPSAPEAEEPVVDDDLGAALLRPVQDDAPSAPAAEEPALDFVSEQPVSQPAVAAARALAPGEFEFEPTGEEEEELELDLDRAPQQLREQQKLEQQKLEQQKLEQQKQEQQRKTPPPPARPAPRPAPVAAPAGQVRRPGGREVTGDPDYNPFAVHFRPKAAPAPAPAPVPPPAPAAAVPLGLLSVDERLERALRGESVPPPVARASERVVPAIDLAPPPPRPAPTSTPPADLLADIEDLVGDVAEEVTGPLVIENTPSKPSVDDDLLAIQAAQEAFIDEVIADRTPVPDAPEDDADAFAALASDEEDGALEVDVDVVEQAAAEVEEEDEDPTRREPVGVFSEPREVSRPHEVSAPHQTVRTPVPERTPDPKADEERAAVRRRLLQRAFVNVGGNAFSREATARQRTSSPEEPQANKQAERDLALEKDVKERLARSAADTHFQRLDLERTATTEQVKEAFLQLAKRYHPDRIGALGQMQLLPQVRDLFGRIKDSYDALVDPASRARYVSELEAKEGAKKTNGPEDAKVAFQKAHVYLKKRDLKNAEAELVRAIDADPQAEYLAELAWTLHSNPQRRDEAKDEVRGLLARALKATPQSDRAFVVAAMVARADGEVERSERHFRKALELNPRNVEAAREVRLIDMRRGSTEKKGGLFDRLRGK